MLAAVTLILTASTALRIAVGNRRIARMRDQDTGGIERWPSVSVIVAARNEQTNIQAALESLLQFDYDNWEIIVVNDRSTDRTGEILNGVCGRTCSPEGTGMSNSFLPDGWVRTMRSGMALSRRKASTCCLRMPTW